MPPPNVRYPRLGLPLETRRLVLRAPTSSDVPVLTRALRVREVTRTIPLWPRITPSDEQEFVQGARKKIAQGVGYPLVLVEKEHGEVVGSAGLEIRAPLHRRGHLGYWVARAHWGKGFATEAASCLCGEAFGTLGLHKLETGVVVGNERSRRVLLHLGFRSEGFEPDNWIIDHRYRDAERFGLLKDQFRPFRPDRRGPKSPRTGASIAAPWRAGRGG